jgi:hypothetical protein
MPSAPFSCSSIGVVTDFSTTSALAPMYCAETCTCGGTSGGYWAIGSVSMLTPPARIMIRAIAEAKTGRVMKKSTRRLPVGPKPASVIIVAIRRSCNSPGKAVIDWMVPEI